MYEFTRVHPPLLADDQDIMGIPAENLKQTVGSSKWTSLRSEPEFALNMPAPNRARMHWTLYTTDFVLTRTLRWAITGSPTRYASDVKYEVTEKKGYKESQKSTFFQALEVTASGIPIFDGIKVDVQADLKITEETYREWTSESETKVTTQFLKGTAYVTWSLIDTLILEKRVTKDLQIGNRTIRKWDWPERSSIDCVVYVYNDSVQTGGGNLLKASIPTSMLHRITSEIGEGWPQIKDAIRRGSVGADTCSADVSASVADAGPPYGIATFDIEVAGAEDSAGVFDFDLLVAREDGSTQTVGRDEVWRFTGETTGTIDYAITLSQDERLENVTVTNVTCTAL